MAAIHARAALDQHPWTEAQFAATLADPASLLLHDDASFALGRVAADESELLLIACDPEVQRQGRGRARLADYESMAAERGAERAFLEVAATNIAALALYQAAGFETVGRRRGYYASPRGGRVDALIMAKTLTNWSRNTRKDQI